MQKVNLGTSSPQHDISPRWKNHHFPDGSSQLSGRFIWEVQVWMLSHQPFLPRTLPKFFVSDSHDPQVLQLHVTTVKVVVFHFHVTTGFDSPNQPSHVWSSACVPGWGSLTYPNLRRFSAEKHHEETHYCNELWDCQPLAKREGLQCLPSRAFRIHLRRAVDGLQRCKTWFEDMSKGTSIHLSVQTVENRVVGFV